MRENEPQNPFQARPSVRSGGIQAEERWSRRVRSKVDEMDKYEMIQRPKRKEGYD
jgi:hypothetical protein